MNCEVTGVRVMDDKVVSLEVRDGGKVYNLTADAVFSSMPIKDLITEMNDVPPLISKIAEGLPYRDFVTVGILVDKLKLTNHTDRKTLGNIIPDCWIYVQDTSVRLGRVQVFNNWSPYMVKDPENTVWIGLEYFCNEGDDFWNLSDSDCVAMAVEELIRIGFIEGKHDVLLSHREKIKKAYPAYFGTYSEMDKVISFLDRFENLYCIGRNGQHRYNNMDHSMVTAFEAVEAFESGRKSKVSIWNVNTEKEYHEQQAAH